MALRTLHFAVVSTGTDGALRFKTVREMYTSTNSEVKWLIPRMLPEQALVVLTGRSKAGKTTFMTHAVKALVEGSDFLENTLKPIRVVYLSEQTKPVFCGQLKEAGIPSTDDLSALTVEYIHGLSWQDIFAAAEEQVQKTDAKLLVLDTWGKFAQFDSSLEDEMATAPTQKRVSVLRDIMAKTGCSVLVNHHFRKSGGNIVDSAAGSGALAQQCDLLLSLSGEPQRKEAKATDMPNRNCRAIQGVGRFSGAIRDAEVIELKDGRYHWNNKARRHLGNTELQRRIQEAIDANPKLKEMSERGMSAELTSLLDEPVTRHQVRKLENLNASDGV